MTSRSLLLLAALAVTSLLLAPLFAWLLASRLLGSYQGQGGAGDYFARIYQGAAGLEWQALALLLAAPAAVGVLAALRRLLRATRPSAEYEYETQSVRD